MSHSAFSNMLSAAKIEIMALAENIFNRKMASLLAELKETKTLLESLHKKVELSESRRRGGSLFAKE